VRIALLTYSTRARGGVVHTLSLAEALAGLGHEVDVWSLARGGDGTFFRPVDRSVTLRLVPFVDIPYETVGERIVRSIAVLGAAFNVNSGPSYDVVHAQDCISANAVPRCVRTIHHLDTFSTPELMACHERAIVRPYAHLCVSAAVAAEVESGWGIRPTVIANGVDGDRFAAAAGDTVTRSAFARELGRYVLSVGGIEPRKGTLDLVEAMAQVRQARPDVKLVVAGGETLFDYRDYRQDVLTRADELAVDPILLGPVDHARLPALFAQADVFAFPSTKEGFGLAAMEAMATGTPVVMRDLPVLREVFGDPERGDAAAFASSVDELATAILAAIDGSDPTQLDRGRQLAATHTWTAAAQAHVDFYRHLLDS
jgi:glycosyltransferase-like protein